MDFDPARLEAIRDRLVPLLDRGLCCGAGRALDGQLCLEQVIAVATDDVDLRCGVITDRPTCVEPAVSAFGRRLNDGPWSSPEARAAGLHDLALAQLGSRGVADPVRFVRRVAELAIREIVPLALLAWVSRWGERYPDHARQIEAAAADCEREGTPEAARRAAYAAYAYARAAYAGAAAAAVRDRVLGLAASHAVTALRELGSPGVALLGARDASISEGR